MQTASVIDPRFLKLLRCPTSGLPLEVDGAELVSIDGTNRYPVVSGIPCLIPDSAEPTHAGYRGLVAENRRHQLTSTVIDDEYVANFVQAMIVPTCGNLFRGANLRGAYPIPEFPTAFAGANVLDVGCNWGRWSIAGAKTGYTLIGMDIHLESLMCARWLSHKLTPANEPFFVLADARYMPFASESFDGIFSYSVLQHFSKPAAISILAEVRRVMMTNAKSLIQIPNKAGVRSRLAMAARMCSDGSEFDVRYYSIDEILSLFASSIGESHWFVDCFCGLNVHPRDRDLVPLSKRWIVDVADILRRASEMFPAIGKFSDSIFVSSTKG
jgi:2-polyprenyl-3-methyl-5-hydroxy-6-metoxy-1,4-benzoquinol methylase